jgi:hypothetical protein
MGSPAEKGQHYFCIRLSSKKDMYVYADRAEVVDGSIVLRSKDGQLNFALASGGWEYCYLASTEDGAPIAVEHWTQDTRGLGSKEGSRFRRNIASEPINPKPRHE